MHEGLGAKTFTGAPSGTATRHVTLACVPHRSSLAQESLCNLLTMADIEVDGSRPWDIHVHDDRFYERVLAEGSLGLGESYMDGWWDCEALDEMCNRAIRAHLDECIPRNSRTLMALAVSMLFNLQDKYRARRVAERHYDLGNEFFATMLDPAMQYSCAYFRGTTNLAVAQTLKLELICRKLGLEPGMRLLDIGCGWGGLAHYAATHYGCEVVGITISRQQHSHASATCRGLPVEIRMQDYRDTEDSFDRIVSVGMMEHVGHKNYRTYLEAVDRCLRDQGLFLCHTIGRAVSGLYCDPWISKHIFPNSSLPSVTQVSQAAEGLFVIEDVHNFGADYDLTLLSWEANFRAAWPRFASCYGERFRRMWRFYLLSCSGAFRARSLQLYQFLLAKEGVRGGYVSVR